MKILIGVVCVVGLVVVSSSVVIVGIVECFKGYMSLLVDDFL